MEKTKLKKKQFISISGKTKPISDQLNEFILTESIEIYDILFGHGTYPQFPYPSPKNYYTVATLFYFELKNKLKSI